MDGDLLFDLPVHPAAAVFPMLGADELAELAADIAANGLLRPIVLDADGVVLVDGRNRLEACRMAGVEPAFECLAGGADPRAYIVSANLQRRNLTKGQAAIALAMIYPEPAKGGRGNVSKLEGFTASRLSEARTILRASADLARAVASGTVQFDAALRRAQELASADKGEDALLARLRAEAPDLAALVVEGRLSVSGAIYELDDRLRKREALLERGRRAAADIVTGFSGHVLAIVAAVEEGEPLRLDGAQFQQLLEGVELLRKRGIVA